MAQCGMHLHAFSMSAAYLQTQLREKPDPWTRNRCRRAEGLHDLKGFNKIIAVTTAVGD